MREGKINILEEQKANEGKATEGMWHRFLKERII